jgi:perosamine synthetase
MAHLQADGIETRPLFYPLHLLPPYQQQANNAGYPVAEQISRHGFSLPTWAGLSSDDVNYVAESLVQYLQLSGRE